MVKKEKRGGIWFVNQLFCHIKSLESGSLQDKLKMALFSICNTISYLPSSCLQIMSETFQRTLESVYGEMVKGKEKKGF